MKMEYKLLNGNDGVIMTREPEIVSGMLYITFTGAPEKATAIFERDDGESAYRALSDGLCGIESDWLHGTIKVTVALLIGSMRADRWLCESFCAKQQENGRVLIYPDNINIQEKIVKLQEGYSDLKDEAGKLTQKVTELETKIIKLLEGYDIV